MALENLGAEAKVGEKSDVYALGVLMWAIAACCEPYAKVPNAFAFMRQITRGIQEEIPAYTFSSYAAILRRCWAIRPA